MGETKYSKWERKLIAVILTTVLANNVTSMDVNASNKTLDFIEEGGMKDVNENSETVYIVVEGTEIHYSNAEEFVNFCMEQEGMVLTEEVFNTSSEEIAEGETAREKQCGENLYWELSEDGVMTISGTGKMWDFYNDAEYYDYHECPWREQREEIKSVVFEEGITYIGAGAFEICKNLTKVTFCDTLTYIGAFSFLGCVNLENFVLPDSLTAIGQQAFEGASKLTSVIIPDNVTFLDSNIFNGCEELIYIYIGGNKNVSSYIASSSPIGKCKALEAIEVSEDNVGLCAIDGVLYTNRDTNWVNDDYIVPENSVQLMQYPAGKKDKTYELAEKTFKIGQFAINAQYLEELILPDTVLEIGECAISDCPKMEKIVFPSSVKKFGDCLGANLKYIENQSSEALWLGGGEYGYPQDGEDKYFRFWKNVETQKIVEEISQGIVERVYVGKYLMGGECFVESGITYQVVENGSPGYDETAKKCLLNGNCVSKVKIINIETTDNSIIPTEVEHYGWKYEVEPYVPTVTDVPIATDVPAITKEPTVPTTSAESYKINYRLNKGKNNQSNPSNYTTKDIKLKAPERKGYTFDGWYTDKNFTNQIKTIKASTKQNITVYAKWTKVTKPSKPNIKSVTNVKGNKLKVILKKKVAGARGCEISYSTDKKWKKSVKTVTLKGTAKTITKLKKNKTYYVRVRAYKLDSAGEKVYGSYSKVKKVKVQK